MFTITTTPDHSDEIIDIESFVAADEDAAIVRFREVIEATSGDFEVALTDQHGWVIRWGSGQAEIAL